MSTNNGLINPIPVNALPSNKTNWTKGKLIVKPDGNDLMIEIGYSQAPTTFTLIEFDNAIALLKELKSTLQELKRRRKNVDRSG